MVTLLIKKEKTNKG